MVESNKKGEIIEVGVAGGGGGEQDVFPARKC